MAIYKPRGRIPENLTVGFCKLVPPLPSTPLNQGRKEGKREGTREDWPDWRKRAFGLHVGKMLQVCGRPQVQPKRLLQKRPADRKKEAQQTYLKWLQRE